MDRVGAGLIPTQALTGRPARSLTRQGGLANRKEAASIASHRPSPYFGFVARLLIALLIVVPILEIWLLFQLGGALGWLQTFALLLFMGFLGGWLARTEGLRTWRRWREALAQGRVPDEGLLSGLLLLLGGVLLIMPGIISDMIGVVLLLPPTRRLIANFLRPRLERRFQTMAVDAPPAVRIMHYQLGDVGQPANSGPQIIDADFEVHDAPRN